MSDNNIMNVKTSFVEKVDLNNAIYMSKIPDAKLLEIFCENIDGEVSRFTHKPFTQKDIKIVVASIKKYIRLALEMKGKIHQQYRFKTENETGRMWIKGVGHQNLRWTVREFLSGKYYWDIDIINAMPTIVQYLKNKNNLNFETPYLDKYVDERAGVLKKYNIDKLTVIIQAFNGKKKMAYYSSYVKSLFDEVMKIKRSILPEYIDNKDELCSKWCSLVYEIENDIIQKALDLVERKNVGAVIFDGFHLDKEAFPNVDDALELLNTNEELQEYGVEFKMKPFEFQHEMDLSLMTMGENYDLSNPESYEQKKIDFEQNFLKINIPLLYIEEYLCPIDNTKKFYIHDNIAKRLESEYYKEIEDGELVLKKFYPKWAADPNKRRYQRIDFLPYSGDIDPSHGNIYNTFKGFKAQEVEQKVTDVDVKWFLDHVRLLVGGADDCVEWLVKYIAHTLQKPAELPGCAVIIRGTQGAGKDALITAQERMIGARHVHRSSNMKEVFGNFNGCLRENIIYQFNEINGNKGFENSEEIKDFITKDYHTINEKNIRPIRQRNCTRSYFFSNGFHIIPVSADDRRIIVFKTCEPRDKKYYENLFSNIYDDEKIDELYTYLSKLDISGFVPAKNRPITDNYKVMQEIGIHPCINWLFEEKPVGNYSIKQIYKKFREYCEANFIPIDKYSVQTITKIIYDLPGVEKKRTGQYRGVYVGVECHKAIHLKFFKHLTYDGFLLEDLPGVGTDKEADSGVEEPIFQMDESDTAGLDA